MMRYAACWSFVWLLMMPAIAFAEAPLEAPESAATQTPEGEAVEDIPEAETPDDKAELPQRAVTAEHTPEAEPEDTAPPSRPRGLYHPGGPGAGAWSLGLGATVDVLPTALVESEARVVPRIHSTFRYGLPAGFTLDASLEAVVLTNELRLGASWAIDVGPITLGLSESVGLVFGHIEMSGFDTSVVAMSHYPGLNFGTTFDGHLFSVGFELLLGHIHSVRVGESTVTQRRNVMHGFAFEITLESPVGSGQLFYGATIYHASPDYQLWLAFSDTNRKLQFVRFKVGYAF